MYQRQSSKKSCQSDSVVISRIPYRFEVYLFAFFVLSILSAFTHAAEVIIPTANNYIEDKPLDISLSQVGLKKHTAKYEFITAKIAFENGEYVLAKRILTPLGMQGDAESQYMLGVLSDLDETAGSSRLNKTQSFIWYHAAAQHGHSDAQHNLAQAYARGEGVEVDLDKAMKWWETAANNGNTDSQYNLGIMYALGFNGVKQNLQRARAWWYHAATQGDAAAQYNLGALYSSESTPFHDSCLALQWLNTSAQNGFARAHDAIRKLGGNKKLLNDCREVSSYTP